MIALGKGKGDYNTRRFGVITGKWRNVVLKREENIGLCFLLTPRSQGVGERAAAGSGFL